MNKLTPSRLGAALLGFALALSLGPTDAYAQQKRPGATTPAVKKAPVASKVSVQVLVVHAKDGEPHVDAALKNIQKSLEYLRYDNFKVLKTNKAELAEGRSSTFQVEGGRKVTVSLISKTDTKCKLRVEMYKEQNKLVDTTVSVNRGGTFIVAGPKYQGGMLILPITANY